jgi:hypothetical protein
MKAPKERTGLYHAGYYLLHDGAALFIRITFKNIWRYRP